jgi:hypothetical protein
MSRSPLIKSAEYARTARQIQVTSNLKAVRKVSNLRKTASLQHVGGPPEPMAEITLPETIPQIASPEPVTEIKLISLPEAQERERHASNMRAIKLVSTSSLSESIPSPALMAKHDPKVGDYKLGKISTKLWQDTKPKRRLSKIPVYALFSDMVNRRREKREKSKLSIRPIIISSPKRIIPSSRAPVGSIANRQNKYQKLPPTPPMSPPAAARKTPMDRHRDMMVYASNLRQDARLVVSQMDESAPKLELLRALEVCLYLGTVRKADKFGTAVQRYGHELGECAGGSGERAHSVAAGAHVLGVHAPRSAEQPGAAGRAGPSGAAPDFEHCLRHGLLGPGLGALGNEG